MKFSWSIKSYQSLPSTQDAIKKLVENDPYVSEGMLIQAIEQTSGYGRYGRTWKGGQGSLMLSLLLTPNSPRGQIATLSLITGLALIETIKSFINSDQIILKWPNDVLINNKKCAGILIESITSADNRQFVIVGMGVNISSAPIDGASYINEYAKTPVDITQLRDFFLNHLESKYYKWQEHGFSAFREEYLNETYDRDTVVGVKLNQKMIKGAFKDIDNDGNLLILCKETQKVQKITSGDVFLV